MSKSPSTFEATSSRLPRDISGDEVFESFLRIFCHLHLTPFYIDSSDHAFATQRRTSQPLLLRKKIRKTIGLKDLARDQTLSNGIVTRNWTSFGLTHEFFT